MRTKVIIPALFLAAIAMYAIGYLYRIGPQADEKTWDDKAAPAAIPIMVSAVDGYETPTLEAVLLWNDAAGVVLFDLGAGGVTVKAYDGEPCGDPWRPESEWGHAATSYRCAGRWEILVSRPGDVHNQFCIVAHEFGHVLGLAHDKVGVMSRHCADVVRVNDKDIEAIKARFGRKE